jgi:hypothetical protein
MAPRSLLVLGLLASAAGPLQAQATVTALRNLDFGIVIQGVPFHVLPNNPTRSGEFQFIAAIGNQVRVQFTLPNRLNGPAGATMPIGFSTTDAIAQGTAPTSVPVTFNPNAAATFNLVTSNRILVWIGGTVTPAGNQRTGTYTNTVTLTITIL